MNQPQPLGEDHDLDLTSLDRELDRVKTSVFLGSNAAFFGPLMCSMEFIWSESISTAATDGIHIWWNPRWFLSLPVEARKTVLIHELKHPAYMHLIRRGERDPKIWNIAADIVINNELDHEGYSFVGAGGIIDHQFDGQPTEAIYDVLYQNPPPCAPWGPGEATGEGEGSGNDMDLLVPDKATIQQTINNVVQAAHSARLSNDAGAIPGETELMLKKFLDPIVPWEQLLYLWFNDLNDEDYSWSRPNHRFQDIYLPSRISNDKLEHLIYYLDVSGSISDQDIIRFNSEVKYIKETFNPQKLTLVQFDTQISDEWIITEDQRFDEVKIVGRGGTAWEPVKKHIEDNKPTCAIIFTDLGFWDPITPIDKSIPVLWCVNHEHSVAPFGKTIPVIG